MTDVRYRPIPQSGGPRPATAFSLAGGPLWFREAAEHRRNLAPYLVPASQIPADLLSLLTAPRVPVCNVSLERPRIMAVLNVTPDSFSDGGLHFALPQALAQAWGLAEAGADFLDIGGESTRPGAEPVRPSEEMARVVPVIAALRADGFRLPISIDTRNAVVAQAAFTAGADLFNDVSALTHDPSSLAVAAASGRPVALVHAQGDPAPCRTHPPTTTCFWMSWTSSEPVSPPRRPPGFPRARLLIDPGIGFGKTTAHNLALIRGLSLLHGLGCPILFGASRKRFIGTIGNAPDPASRVPGSIAVALEALRQGAQVVRVHDVKETRQAMALWSALNGDTE